MEKMNSLAVYAVDDEEQMYVLYETKDSQEIGSGAVSFTLPDTRPPEATDFCDGLQRGGVCQQYCGS